MRLEVDCSDDDELVLRLVAASPEDVRTLATVRAILTLVADVERQQAGQAVPLPAPADGRS